MRSSLSIATVATFVCLVIAADTSAQAAEDEVEAAIRDLYEAINKGDAAATTHHFLPGGDTFGRDGTLLYPHSTTEELQSLYDAGLEYEVYLHHIDGRVYGDAAVATWYTSGHTDSPDGTTFQGTYRASGLWIKRSGQWKAAHFHISRLETSAR